ncbi:MAG: ATP-binding cassette domain-containing protein [Coriobacteriales bacterium]|jgi:ATPase subunit of ABC transporter with duplicated ATPase domains|nr:ATP-binding cassette domain-containing protein [Coriobacteriales bacterium]
MQITVNKLSYTYEDAPAPALGPLSATFAEGWTGVVGSNGSGKSTLLRLVTGDLGGFTGSIVPAPARPPVPAPAPASPSTPSASSYCAQATECPPAQVEEFALDFGGDAMRIRRILGIQDDWAWRFDTLSHGERKRLQVAVALWLNPPVLALDEPTNHVDAVTREQILTALRHYRGVGLLVSHDRDLLDALVSHCLFMRDGSGTMRSGTYTQAREQEELEHTTVARERRAAKQELSHLHAERQRRSHEAARADARRSKKNIDPKDHSAKAKIDLAVFTGQDGKAGRLSAQLGSRIQAVEQRVASAFVPKVYDSSFWLDTQPSKRRVLVELKEGSIELGDRRTLRFPRLFVDSTAHIGLTGPNGAGKSTLVRHLVAQLPADVPVIYLPQELDSAEARELLSELKALGPEERGQVLSIVARLNSDPARILSGEALSPGELRKVLLARGVLRAPQLIIMDEPTNHLDLHSTEALEAALASCPCALVLVSHDAAFLKAATTTRWLFDLSGHVRLEQ